MLFCAICPVYFSSPSLPSFGLLSFFIVPFMLLLLAFKFGNYIIGFSSFRGYPEITRGLPNFFSIKISVTFFPDNI